MMRNTDNYDAPGERQELAERKYEFFYKPTTKEEIIGDREVVAATKYDLAQRVRNLSGDQAIILDNQDPDQKLIPGSYEGSQNFLKHGRKVFIDSRDPMWISREEKFSRIHERKENNPDYFAEFSGISWKPRGVDERSRYSHLVDSVEAVRIFHYIRNAPDFQELLDFSHEARPPWKGQEEGANYCVDMTSRSGERKKNVAVTLRHVPFTREGDPSRVISSLDAQCDCQYFRFHNLVYQNESSGRKSPVFMDMHAIAAYLFVVDRDQRELDKEMEPFYAQMRAEGSKVDRVACVAMQENPFALPQQTTLNDYLKFERQVMIKDVVADKNGHVLLKKNGEPRIKHRKTNRSEKELFLFNYIARYGPRTFFATKRLREYHIAF